MNQLRNPPQGGSIDLPEAETRPASFRDPASAAWDANGCLPAKAVLNGCCNSAFAGPTVQGNECCYDFCTGACCGRPLLVGGTARVASLTPRGDWRSGRDDDWVLGAVDQATRSALASAWARDARMEHASIASFARFTMELLAVGAPPDLVAASQRASLDEIAHARTCFEIASKLAGSPVGPGQLDLVGAEPAATLAEVAAAAVREGCVGETCAALFARAGSERAADAFVQNALATIAAEEASHAELAWKFVRWALDQRVDGVTAAVRVAFETALRAVPLPDDPPPYADVAAWRALGRLDSGEARAIAESAIRDVVLPCAQLLQLDA